eukprot:scaffold292053_cov16-Prasinocladus_malaysianus.AAC.1
MAKLSDLQVDDDGSDHQASHQRREQKKSKCRESEAPTEKYLQMTPKRPMDMKMARDSASEPLAALN